jgi:hypothetical protein
LFFLRILCVVGVAVVLLSLVLVVVVVVGSHNLLNS